MSDDDSRRRGPKGPRGPHKPGGLGGGSRSGSDYRPGAFRDAPPSGERSERPRRSESDRSDRQYRSERPERGERPFNRPRPEGADRPGRSRQEGTGDGFKPRGTGKSFGPRKDFGDRPPRREFSDHPPRTDGDRPFRKPRFDRPEGERREEGFKPRTPRGDGPRRDFGDRPPRREFSDRPPRRFRDDERPQRSDDRGAERPRSASRPERRPFLPREGNPERLATTEKAGGVERIAKVIARAGAASRRDAEAMIEQGRVSVDGEVITSPALDVLPTARITIDGEKLPARERTRLWLYHKPSGLVSTNHDPEGRITLFETLPEDLPRVITIGRLDINTEGLLLLTNDGGLARVLGHPETAWLRRYRVRAYGLITQDKLDAVRGGVTIDGENFGPVVATRDREVGDNTWLTVDLREGKNREVKRVLEHLGLTVNRLIRISFGPFQLGDLAEGEVEEVRTKVLRDQLGEQLASIAGVDFDAPVRNENRLDRPHAHEDERGAGRRPDRAAPRRDERGERPRFGDRGERPRFERDVPTDKPARKPREGAYHRAREESGDAPRDILLRAEEGRGAIWRDEDTTQMKPKRTGPRRGSDPREERAQREAAGGRERVRAKPIEDPKGRRVTVERVTGSSPDIPRKPRYTRADFAPSGGDERPARRPRQEDDRPPRRKFVGGAPWGSDKERPPRTDGDRPFKPRGPRSDAGPHRDSADRPPRKDFGDRPARGARPPRAEGERSFRPREDGERTQRPFREGGKPPFKGGPRSGPPRSGGTGGGDKPRGPRKPRF
ncbi:MAG: pseudouridine synthase [Hyphomicrobiales bacterium]|nr:pseudouridine synthase [Hyphomicrobiales bacterium]